MPVYEFECPYCAIRFKRNLKMDTHPSHPCPECECDAPRLWEGFGGHSFAAGDGPTANSGVHDHDYPTADRAVGRDAEARWGEIHEREKIKEAVRQGGQTHAVSRKNGEGFVEYTAMTDEAMAKRKAAYRDATKVVWDADGQ